MTLQSLTLQSLSVKRDGSFKMVSNNCTSGSQCAAMERSLSFKNWEFEEPAKPESNGPSKTEQNGFDLKPEKRIVVEFTSPRPISELNAAATKLQKVYKSYRTRRNLADCAVVIEELWWKALDFASLKHSSVSFFNEEKPESMVSKWARAGKRAAKVGKGLSKDEKAQKLALQHWLEAIDPRHRYGHNLHLYYDVWFNSESTEPFFYWLDVGAGRDIILDKCSRTKLQSQIIKYLGPNEREAYEVIVEEGKLMYKQSEDLVNTTEGSKWIFVLSTTRALYVGQKKKGEFQHSSFLAGAATTAAGRLVAKEGILQAIWPYSGHYLPTEENFKEFISFLQENNVDLKNVKRCSVDDDDYNPLLNKSKSQTEVAPKINVPELEQQKQIIPVPVPVPALAPQITTPHKWSSGIGARIGCVRDYPLELQSKALEQVNLSPRVALSPSNRNMIPIPSPRPSPKVRLSPSIQYMGIPTPTASPKVRASPRNQHMGIPAPAVALTLPKFLR